MTYRHWTIISDGTTATLLAEDLSTTVPVIITERLIGEQAEQLAHEFAEAIARVKMDTRPGAALAAQLKKWEEELRP